MATVFAEAIGILNINVIRGDTVGVIEIAFMTDDEPLDITGSAFKMTIADLVNKANVLATITPTITAPNIITIDTYIPNAKPNTYRYDIQSTLSNGMIKTVLKGTFTIKDDVTQ